MLEKKSMKSSDYNKIQQEIITHFNKNGYENVKVIPINDKSYTSVERLKDQEILIVK